MISYHEATKLIESLSINIRETLMPIKNSIGFYLSRDLFSPMDSPSFNQSAMDGYAVIKDDLLNAVDENIIYLDVIEEIPAGSIPKLSLSTGQASRIMTGAPIPSGSVSYTHLTLPTKA